MSLVDDVSTAIIDAMRRKDADRLSALRMLKAAMMNKSVEKGHELDDAEARQVVGALVKQRRDSIEQFQKGGRQDLVDKESAELKVLEAYLPARLGADEIAAEVATLIAEAGAQGAADMGKVMAAAKARFAGRAEMSLVSASVKAALAR